MKSKIDTLTLNFDLFVLYHMFHLVQLSDHDLFVAVFSELQARGK
jgi:hypothetical protein